MLLDVRNLSVRYGRIKVLHGIDLRLDEGEIVAVVGANGAGKTTALRAISGMIPAESGRVLFEGRTVDLLRSDQRVALGIAQVAEGRQVFGRMTVDDNLRLGAYRRQGPGSSLEAMFARFPVLREKRRLPASMLSGGQQQVLAMARALMSDPRLILLDEPSMGLAPLMVKQIFALVRELRAAGTSILLVEQNARAALALADRAYVLENGVIALSGAAADVAASDGVKRAYLGH